MTILAAVPTDTIKLFLPLFVYMMCMILAIGFSVHLNKV